MALESIIDTFSPNGRYYHRLTVTLVSQDVNANTSTVRFNYGVQSQVSFANGSWTTLNDTYFSARINGVDHVTAPNFDFRVSKDLVPVGGQLTIQHNADGKKTIEIRLACTDNPGSSFFQAVERIGSFVLPDIPRASKFTVTPNPVIEGGSVNIAIQRAVGTFTHDITWTSGSSSGTIGTGVGTSATWTPDPDLLGGGVRVPITITIQTKSGSTNIGAPISRDIMLVAMPEYPEIGQGTPYDLRFRRVTWESNKLTQQENIPFIEATITDEMSATGSCVITIANDTYSTNLDGAVVVADVYDGAQWMGVGLLYVLTRTEGDRTDMTGVAKYTGMSYVDYILSKGIVNGDFDWPETNPGNIIFDYIGHGYGRGWGTGISRGFSASRTSINTPWQHTTDINASDGTPISQLLDGFVNDVLLEYRTRFDPVSGRGVLDLYNPGYGSDWTIQGANPIVNLSTSAMFKVVDSAPVRKDFSDKLTRVKVSGDETSLMRDASSAVQPIFGHLEGTVSATGVKDSNRLAELGDAVLSINASATVERTFSYDLSSTQTPAALFPYRTFRPGDWILVPGDDAPERVRVSQVSITRNAEGTNATVTVGDMIPSGVAATARKLAQAGGGAIAGGTMRSPVTLSSAIPAAPTGVAAIVDGFWDATGAPKAGVAVSWNPITRSLSNTSMTVDVYEVWTRPEVGSQWSLAALADVPNATITPININQPLDIRVRGRSLAGVYGAYSDEISVVTPEPDETLLAPSTPLLEVDALGTVLVTWNGLIGGGTPPLWFNFVQAEISDSMGGAYTVAGQQLASAGGIAVPNVGAGTWWFRLVGYDTLNHRGAVSSSVSIAVVPLNVDTREPKAPTDVVAISEGFWNGSTAGSNITVTWTPVTEGIDNDPIDILVYEVWGKLSTDTTYNWMGATTASEITVNPVSPVGAEWDIVVTATAVNNERSAFSDVANVTMVGPDMDLLAPTEPSLTSSRGLVLVEWDGKIGVDTPAPDYMSHVDIEVSTDGGTTWTVRGFMPRGTRTQSISGVAVGAEAQVRLVAYDILGQASSPSVVASIVVVGISGPDIEANSIGANQITAGSISVNHVEPSFGDDLNISGNGTISIISGQAANAQDSADAAADSVAAMRTRYDFTPTEAVISQPGSVFQVAISNTQLEFRESGVARAYLNAGVFTAPRMASAELVLKYQVIMDDPSDAGTVIRRR